MSAALMVAMAVAFVAGIVLARLLKGGGYETVTPGRAAELLRERDVVLLDVRTKAEYRFGRIPGARLIPMKELERQLEQLPRDGRVVVYCASGLRSRLVARRLAGWSRGKVFNLAGGLDAWRKSGLPVER